ncbi:hypothetical protein BP5796_11829 [Coleophoma crateriformis]|uniref:Xylanolytic transcriptional activator regulatory domain-containing protein n=1 Tax=Coleophoma crateriformis TaxID=565419 RepID=A0A3D8QEF7_9HELO|nr:hypothetical protein BP5796_11829 [Coleophoma crateriformis]
MDVECRYVISLTPKPADRKVYIRALEDRVAQLETYLSSLGQFGAGEDHWQQGPLPQETPSIPEQDEVDALLDAVRGLSLSASGHYIGGTSTITLGRLLGSVVKNQRDVDHHRLNLISRTEDSPNPKSISSESLTEIMSPMFVSPNVAQRLFEGFLKHIATRFPVVHTPRIREIHARRSGHLDLYEESILHLVYATGGRFLETTGETGNFFCDQHYEAALQNMDHILSFRDTRSLSYLLLLAIYCLRSPRDPGAWNFVRLAMTPCIELGLHRSSQHKPSLKSELDKRLFWSCYYLDREISIALGRPLAISDNDIDVELPLDINEEIEDLDVILKAAEIRTDYPLNPSTSLTSFVHHIRLKRIESEIQQTIYRVNSTTPIANDTIQGFLDRLSVWERLLPMASYRFEDHRLQPFDGIDAYMVAYHKCVRLLLYPQLSEKPINKKYLNLCAQACGGVCTRYKSLHHSMNIGFSPLSLQNVFLAGLTLIYCAWLSSEQSAFPLTGPLTDCSIMLYVMAERWPLARKYRDVFEHIKSLVLDIITQGKHKLHQPVGNMSTGIQETLAGINEGMTRSGKADLEQMVGHMTGEKAMPGSGISNEQSNLGEFLIMEGGTEVWSSMGDGAGLDDDFGWGALGRM